MTQSLVAPQFGLAADHDAPTKHRAPRTASADADELASASWLRNLRSTNGGPTVVVKRRRLVAHDGGSAGGEAGASSGAAAPAEAKAPKVFRVDPPALQAPGIEAEASSAAPAAEAQPQPAADPRPRRRNPATAPRLVRHVVFERPAAAAAEPEAPVARADMPVSFVAPGSDRPGYEAVCRALQRVRDALEAARAARRLLGTLAWK
jgi:hypothetical protein